MRIVREQGSHCLVERDGQFAVVEHRAGQVLAVRDGERSGAVDTPEGMASIIGSGDWTDRETAERRFAELTERGDDLAKKIW